MERYEDKQFLQSGQGQWLHLRVTNIGVINHAGLTIACELPNGWRGSEVVKMDWGSTDMLRFDDKGGKQTISTKPDFVRHYAYRESLRKIYFEPLNDPQDTGPGASSVYSFYVNPPAVKYKTESEIKVFVSCNESVGTTTRRLRAVMPHFNS